MGLKLHAVSLVASIVFHTCVRSRTDWACCESKKADKTGCLQHLVPLLKTSVKTIYGTLKIPMFRDAEYW